MNPNPPPYDQCLKRVIFGTEGIMRLAVAVFSAFLLTGLPTLAAEQPDFETCSKSEEPDLTVASCTRVIDDQTLAPQIRGAALFFRPLALETKRDLKGAMADLDKAIRIDPKSLQAYAARGSMYQWQGDNDLAIADYNEILRLEPKADYTLYSRGTAYRDKGNLDQAIADYTDALRINPNYTPAHHERGVAY